MEFAAGVTQTLGCHSTNKLESRIRIENMVLLHADCIPGRFKRFASSAK